MGPHAAPSNLFWKWHEGLLEFVHNNTLKDLVAMSEMVEPADSDWVTDFSSAGFPKKMPCHLFGGGAVRDRMLFVDPNVAMRNKSPTSFGTGATGRLGEHLNHFHLPSGLSCRTWRSKFWKKEPCPGSVSRCPR